MPVSESLKQVLASVARITRKRDSKTIEPLHLLAEIVEDREGKLAQLLLDHGVTRQKVAQALDAAPDLP
jgi:ATP-dependent Clp protease ATP-binding subunit ClpA